MNIPKIIERLEKIAIYDNEMMIINLADVLFFTFGGMISYIIIDFIT